MSANGPPADLIVPPGFSAPGMHGDAAPDSVLGQLRADVKARRAAQAVTLDLPPIGTSELRATYGTLDVDQVERYVASAQLDATKPLTANLDVLARACRCIEVRGLDGQWVVLEDDAGPVSFDDRLARLLAWERPGDEFRYAVRDVYEGMFAGDGFALMAHQAKVLTALGLVEAEVGADLSTRGSSTRSAQPPRSG
jgi:hypothetical protein